MATRYSQTITPGARFALNYFLLFTVFAVVTPYFQVLLRRRGFDPAQIGLILGAFELTGLLAPPVWGWVSDHTRRRRGLLAALVCLCGVVFLSFPLIEAFWIACAAAALFGVFYRPIIPLTDGMTIHYLSEHGGDYGRPRAAGSVAFVLTVVSLETFARLQGDLAPNLIVGSVLALCLLHAVSIAWLPPAASDRTARSPAPRQSSPVASWGALLCFEFIVLTAAAFLGRFAMMGYYSFFSLYLEESMGFRAVGYLWLLGPVSELPVIFFSGAIIRRIGARALFILGLLGAALRLGGYALAPSVAWVIPLQFLHALTFGAFHTGSVHIVNRLAPPGMKQRAVTLFAALAYGVPAVVGSAAGGWLIEMLGYRWMYAVYGAVALAGALGAFYLLPEHGNRPQGETTKP